jgi:hypothetical protein
MKRKYDIVFIFTVLAFAGPAILPAAADTERQQEVAKRGAQVMPFELAQTTHVFKPLADGGLQRVVVKDPNNRTQIALIRSHLKEEAARFHRGDFSDPAKIHDADMPGLAELSRGAADIGVRYAERPDGAEIRYTAKDPALVDAIHRWFQAQLHDHGHDATMHMHE